MKTSKLILTLSAIILITTLLTLIVTLNKYGVITGKATDTGDANITIAEAASISFTDAECNFGSGSVNETPDRATVNSENSVTNGTWTPILDCLTLSNDGNVNLSVNLSSSAAADTFIGGNAGVRSMKWKATDGGDCNTGNGISSYTEINTTDDAVACADLDVAGTIDLDLELVIPEDAVGTKGTVITAEGTAV